LNRIRREISWPIRIGASPAGASVYVKPNGNPDSPWLFIGQAPLENFLLPIGYYRWRIEKQGFRTVEGAAGIHAPSIEFVLDPEGSVPPDMVHVPRGGVRLFTLNRVDLDDFWMDKYEVTSKQFKEFVDRGGYRNRQYWREEFLKEGRALSWEQAMGGVSRRDRPARTSHLGTGRLSTGARRLPRERRELVRGRCVCGIRA